MGQRGPVSLAELVDQSAGIAREIVDLLESDPAVRSRPSIGPQSIAPSSCASC